MLNIKPLKIEGSYGISSVGRFDQRGSLFRMWENNELLNDFKIAQASFVSNPHKGTLRGLHFQFGNWAENKIIYCLSGLIFDVVLDLRPNSSTFKLYDSLELGPHSAYQGVIVPVGCAHGYLTRKTDTDLIYFMDKEYSSEYAAGILWNDPEFSVAWPEIPKNISKQDRNWPKFKI